MLIICPAQSLARRLQVKPNLAASRPDQSPLAEWYARDFRIQQVQLVLFTNPATTLSFVIEGAPYKTVVDRFARSLIAYLEDMGWSAAPDELGPVLAKGVRYLKGADRSTTGIMTQILLELEMEIQMGRARLTDLDSINRRLRTVLVGGARPGGYKYPLERLEELVGLRPRDNVRRIY